MFNLTRTLVLTLTLSVMYGCATTTVKANFVVARRPESLVHCDFIGTFKMHFDSDKISQYLAPAAARRRSVRDFQKVVAAGANTIFRVDPAPAPLVKVNAYRCNINDLVQSEKISK